MNCFETDLDEDLKNIVGAQIIKLFKEAAVDQNEAFEESSTVSRLNRIVIFIHVSSFPPNSFSQMQSKSSLYFA
jgi:hypothetical protein